VSNKTDSSTPESYKTNEMTDEDALRIRLLERGEPTFTIVANIK